MRQQERVGAFLLLLWARALSGAAECLCVWIGHSESKTCTIVFIFIIFSSNIRFSLVVLDFLHIFAV